MAVVQCPTCGDPVVWSAASLFRPFCSDRCKNVDLGAWASGQYAIAEDLPADGELRDGDEAG